MFYDVLNLLYDTIFSYCSNNDVMNIIKLNNIELNNKLYKLNNKYNVLKKVRNNLTKNKVNNILIDETLKIYNKSEIHFRILKYPYYYYSNSDNITKLITNYYNSNSEKREKKLIDYFIMKKTEYRKKSVLCRNYIDGFCCKSIYEIYALEKLSNIIHSIGYRYWLLNRLKFEDILKRIVLREGIKWEVAVDILIEGKTKLSKLYIT